ncbi:hypothetical protein [uncultured Jatrophihabitans sp.]|uniref:hypothetical protein n=1 Tax=uncultured Jatrophihabitans sp. TaxID=1610747 RepID=UPI0035CBD3C0
MDDHLVGDVVRLVDTASFGWAGLRRWRLDRGSAAASAGEVRQDPGTGAYQLRRMFAGTGRIATLPATYDVHDTSGQLWLRVELANARRAHTAPATVSSSSGRPVGVVPSVRRAPLGAGFTVTARDGAPLLVVPAERGLSWSALDPAGVPVARVEHLAVPAGWVDRSLRAGFVDRATSRRDDPTLSGDVISFERSATALHRALVLGVAICRAHPRS